MEATKFLIWLEKQLPETEADNSQEQQGNLALSKNPRLGWVVGQYVDSGIARDGIEKPSRAQKEAAIRSLTAAIR